MPSYNQARYLERSILSVLNQGYSNLEFIIIDGGSTDGSIEIIKKYEGYIAYWHSRPDSGQSDALNQGFSKATGDIFGWLNSDDLYLSGAFEHAVEAFSLHCAARVVFGDWWEIDSEDKVTCVQHAFDFSLGHFIYEGFHLNSQSMFWRREVHERFGDFDVKLHRTMDYDLILRIGLAEGQDVFSRIPYPLACFRRHEEQKTIGFDSAVYNEHHQIALRNGLGNKYSLLGDAIRLIYRFRRAYWYVKRGGFTNLVKRSGGWRKRLKDIMHFRVSHC
jgi:glycosyltransferase involved in cell wall biosynthesis